MVYLPFSVYRNYIPDIAFGESRALARKEIPNFVEIYTKATLDTCIKRDPKGLYKKAQKGEIKNMTGLQSPYEEPQNPEIILETEKSTSFKCMIIWSWRKPCLHLDLCSLELFA